MGGPSSAGGGVLATAAAAVATVSASLPRPDEDAGSAGPRGKGCRSSLLATPGLPAACRAAGGGGRGQLGRTPARAVGSCALRRPRIFVSVCVCGAKGRGVAGAGVWRATRGKPAGVGCGGRGRPRGVAMNGMRKKHAAAPPARLFHFVVVARRVTPNGRPRPRAARPRPRRQPGRHRPGWPPHRPQPTGGGHVRHLDGGDGQSERERERVKKRAPCSTSPDTHLSPPPPLSLSLSLSRPARQRGRPPPGRPRRHVLAVGRPGAPPHHGHPARRHAPVPARPRPRPPAGRVIHAAHALRAGGVVGRGLEGGRRRVPGGAGRMGPHPADPAPGVTPARRRGRGCGCGWAARGRPAAPPAHPGGRPSGGRPVQPPERAGHARAPGAAVWAGGWGGGRRRGGGWRRGRAAARRGCGRLGRNAVETH